MTTPDSAGVFLARSTDGGDSWAEYELGDHNFKPAPIGGLGQGYQGDNIDIVSTSTTLWPVWMDNTTGIYQVWTAPVDISSLSGVEEESAVGSRQLAVRVYPNPFTTSTTISYFVPERSLVTLKIYDLTGNEVAVLVDGVQPAGSYSTLFRVRGNCELGTANRELTCPGVYLFRLTVNHTTHNGKIIFSPNIPSAP
jgi:hypothetical protein